MNKIENRTFGGERPLFAINDVQLVNVQFNEGESALKEARNVQVESSVFKGKYPFWHNCRLTIKNSLFTPGGRAAIWYCENIRMENSRVDAPKMFREIERLYLSNINFTDAEECIWHCRNIEMTDVDVKNGTYVFKNCENIKIENLKLQGNYSFQYTENVIIRNAHISSKDAFWNSKNVTVYDSVIDGEYLGWHSKNLRLVNCEIRGTQPLCYADNLVLENCTMAENCDLAFEYSNLNAEINSAIKSVKNPSNGKIITQSIGELIIDEHCKNQGGCKIIVNEEVTV